MMSVSYHNKKRISIKNVLIKNNLLVHYQFIKKVVYCGLDESQKFLHVYTSFRSVLNERPPDVQNPLQKHACKQVRTLRALVSISFRSLQNVHWTFCNSNSRKPLEKGLTLNFLFCTQYRF